MPASGTWSLVLPTRKWEKEATPGYRALGNGSDPQGGGRWHPEPLAVAMEGCMCSQGGEGDASHSVCTPPPPCTYPVTSFSVVRTINWSSQPWLQMVLEVNSGHTSSQKNEPLLCPLFNMDVTPAGYSLSLCENYFSIKMQELELCPGRAAKNTALWGIRHKGGLAATILTLQSPSKSHTYQVPPLSTQFRVVFEPYPSPVRRKKLWVLCPFYQRTK